MRRGLPAGRLGGPPAVLSRFGRTSERDRRATIRGCDPGRAGTSLSDRVVEKIGRLAFGELLPQVQVVRRSAVQQLPDVRDESEYILQRISKVEIEIGV